MFQIEHIEICLIEEFKHTGERFTNLKPERNKNNSEFNDNKIKFGIGYN